MNPRRIGSRFEEDLNLQQSGEKYRRPIQLSSKFFARNFT
jgi:hypothetical protein